MDADGEAVLVDEVANELHLLNASGALLWSLFDGESALCEICFDVADALDIPYEQVLEDALGVVEDLADRGLCHDGREPPPAGRADKPFARPRRLLEEPPSG